MVALIKLVISFSDLNYKLFLSISKNLEATYASSQKTPHNTTQQQANNNSGPVAFCLVKDPIKSSCPTHTLSLLFSSLLFSQTSCLRIRFFKMLLLEELQQIFYSLVIGRDYKVQNSGNVAFPIHQYGYKVTMFEGKTVRGTMSLACLVCHSVENLSPSHSFRRSVSNSDNEGRCYAIANCLTRKLSVQPPTVHSFLAASTSKVTPQPSNTEIPGPPRLVRSRAVRRDIVQDWNFDEVVAA
ncbi:hypothetical protein MTR_1g097080 [Medicago truncatula]|uniref:Uncharacterized protein n=2 Tax=Medicago truncatula TaxID=3880 RepID=A0A072VPK3_MEDTR|nr:hypothetical protein MTR_1g097080 [Medicago truncatula]